MPKTQKVAQKKWIKGVVAASQTFAQPQGSFPRASNVVYVRRGSLYTCDGSMLISAFNGAVQPVSTNLGPFTDIALYQPQGGTTGYFGIAKDYNTHLAAPTSAAASGTGSGVLTGAYKWEVTALDGAGGETTVSNEASATLTAQKGAITWTAVTNATGYNIYRTKVGGASGTELFSGTSTTNSYTDNVADVALGASPPATNTTQVCQFYAIPATSFGAANIIFTFPADVLPRPNPTPGNWGGSPGTPSGGGQTPAGGVPGNLSSIPQILQFNNLMVLILGNGVTPYTSDGTTGNTIPIVNNFQDSYGARTASTVQNVGDQIEVAISATNYIFTATQAGTTGAGGAPSFSATLGSIVADGTVYWQNTGAIAQSIAPRGAAHGIIYAGSLWIGNTHPTTTSDNFDGPSCLKMSDLNNPNSWNPLNVAFLDRDDGTSISGMATFTLAEAGIPPTGSLVVFKDFSTFQINGVFGASDFSIQRAQTDLGCVAPRSIQFVPGFGIARMTHLGIAVFDGVRDRLLSEEIRPYIFGGSPGVPQVDWSYIYFSKAAQTVQPPMYSCAVPLIPNNAPLGFTPFVAAVTTTGVTLPSGSYYLTVQAIFGNGSTMLSQELGPVVVNSTSEIGISVSQTPPGLYKWRVFFGIGSGNETQYQDFAPGAQIRINATGNPGNSSTLNGQLNRLLCYDLVLKSWTVIDLPFPISVFHQYRVTGSIPITAMGGFSDGGFRRWLGGAGLDTTWDAGAVNAGAPDANIRSSVRTPEVFGKDASDRIYFRQLAVRGTGSPVGITGSVTINGITGITTTPVQFSTAPMGGGEFVAYASIGVTGLDAYATISWIGVAEIQSVDWYCIPKDVRARVAV